MRKIILLLGLSIFAFACSVNREELPEKELLTSDLVTTIEGCTVKQYELGDAAQVEVRNFYDHLKIKVSAQEISSLNQINYHFAENEARFPTTKKGKFLLGQMDYKNKYPQGTIYEEFKIPISEVPEEFAMVIYAEYGSGKNKGSAWAGDISVEGEDWSYFNYVVEPFPFYAGTDQVGEITLSEVIALPGEPEIEELYLSLLEPGVAHDGNFDPSIWNLIDAFNEAEDPLGEYSTTYTLGIGECSDSVELTMRVIPDP